MLFKDPDDAGKVQQGPAEPVHFVAQNTVNLAGFDVGEESPKGGPVHVASAKAAVVVALRQALPALVPLALDVGQSRFALRVQGVEVLLQSLLAGLARVNSAADCGR